MTKTSLVFFLAVALPIQAQITTAKYSTPFTLPIASLTDPTKLATLKGERAAKPRLQKCLYWLAYDKEQGKKPVIVLGESAK